MECMFQILLENHTVHVKLWYKDAGLEMGSQTSTTALGENCTNLTSTGMHAANMKSCGCAVLVTAMNLTGTVNGTQGTVPSKRHRFRFHGGDEWAEKNAIYDQCSPPYPRAPFPPKSSQALEEPAQHSPFGRCVPPPSCLAVRSLK